MEMQDTRLKIPYTPHMHFDVLAIRREFPILNQQGTPVIYLDNAATTQKPLCVLEAMDAFYSTANANVHRGVHGLAEAATNAYEDARATIAQFIHAHSHEVILTKGCTESINLVAKSWGKANLKAGDTVVLSILEHHSNIVPWLQLKEEVGITLKWIELDETGELDLAMLEAFLDEGNVKLVSITGQSNVLGTRPPIEEISRKAHAAGALVLIDAAQLIAHQKIDVQTIDCDFLTFSGHKLYGPTGIGVLYAKQKHLLSMPPFLGGGMMIHEVSRDHFSSAEPPAKFEAGTPPIAEAIGLQAAINWLTQFNWKDIETHESMLITTALNALKEIPEVQILPNSKFQIPNSCVSFTHANIHPHDLTDFLGKQGIHMRAGHHCAEPLHETLGVNASTRVSVGIYNTEEDIESVIQNLQNIPL